MNIAGNVNIFSVNESDNAFMCNATIGVGDKKYQRVTLVFTKSSIPEVVSQRLKEVSDLIDLRTSESDTSGNIKPVTVYAEGQFGEVKLSEYKGNATATPTFFVRWLQGTAIA